MTLPIELFSYLSAFFGAMLEGEVAIMASLQISRLGDSNFYGILIAAFFGTQLMDWSIYLSGRYNGRAYVQKRPKVQARLDKMDIYMDRYANGLLFFYRFMYGFRIALPLLFGLSAVPIRKFAIFSLLGTLLWLSLIGTFGHYLSTWLGL